MIISVDVRPEVAAELGRQAAAHGRALEAHAASLLEAAAHVPAASVKPGTPAEANNLVDLFAPVRGLFADGELDFSRNPSTGRPRASFWPP
jgi:hypothetical protein